MVKRIKSQLRDAQDIQLLKLKTIIPHLKKGKLATSIPLRVFTKLSLHKHYIFIIAKRETKVRLSFGIQLSMFHVTINIIIINTTFPHNNPQ